jgi:hypothetical protein
MEPIAFSRGIFRPLMLMFTRGLSLANLPVQRRVRPLRCVPRGVVGSLAH